MKFQITINKEEQMREEYAQLLPKWYQCDEEHDLVLSDDIDSLASCAVLNMVKDWKVRYFYDFNAIYASKQKQKRRNRKCWVDIATYRGRAFDNHVSRISDWDIWNKDMINLNQLDEITNWNYTDKYAGSTLLTVWSIYDIPLPETEEGKMLLLCIDSTYKGFYAPKFKGIQKHYLLDILGLEGLYEVIQRHKANEFEDLIEKYKLRRKIYYEDGILDTDLPLNKIGKLLGINLTLPKEEFYEHTQLEQILADVTENHYYADDICPDIKTLAITYKNRVKYSIVKEIRKDVCL